MSKVYETDASEESAYLWHNMDWQDQDAFFDCLEDFGADYCVKVFNLTPEENKTYLESLRSEHALFYYLKHNKIDVVVLLHAVLYGKETIASIKDSFEKNESIKKYANLKSDLGYFYCESGKLPLYKK